METNAAIEAALIGRLRQWMRATFEGDRALQEEIEHEDAIFTYPNGRRYSRDEHIALTGNAQDVEEHDITFFRVDVHGDDLAIVWLDHTLRTRLRDDPFNEPVLRAQMENGITFGMSSTWLRCESGWRVICMDAHVLHDRYVPRERRDTPNIVTYP